MKYYLAIDLGATSGRHVIGYLENGEIVLKEIHRFKTEMDNSPDLHALKDANKVLHLGHEIFFGNKEDYLKSQSYQIFMDKGGEQ